MLSRKESQLEPVEAKGFYVQTEWRGSGQTMTRIVTIRHHSAEQAEWFAKRLADCTERQQFRVAQGLPPGLEFCGCTFYEIDAFGSRIELERQGTGLTRYLVEIEKQYVSLGQMLVESYSSQAAVEWVRTLLNADLPLQSCDPRITWQEPELVDGSMAATGEVCEAD